MYHLRFGSFRKLPHSRVLKLAITQPYHSQHFRKYPCIVFAEETQQKSQNVGKAVLVSGNRGSGGQALVSGDGWQIDADDSQWNGNDEQPKKSMIILPGKLLRGVLILISMVFMFYTVVTGKPRSLFPWLFPPQHPPRAETSTRPQQPLASQRQSEGLQINHMSEQDSQILERKVDANDLAALSSEHGVEGLAQRTSLAVRAAVSASQAAQRAAAYASSAQTAASKAAEAAESGCLAALKAQQALEKRVEAEVVNAQAKAEVAEQMAKQAEEKAAELSALATAYQDSSESQALVAQETVQEEVQEENRVQESWIERIAAWYHTTSAKVINFSNAAVGTIMSFFISVWLYIKSGYSWIVSFFISIVDWIVQLVSSGGGAGTGTGTGVAPT